MRKKRDSLVIVEEALDLWTVASGLDIALDPPVSGDPFEYLRQIAHPPHLVLTDSSVAESAGEDGGRLVFEDQRNNG